MFQIRILIGLLILVLPIVAVGAPVKAKQPVKKPATSKHDPLVEAQLRASFGRMDLNRDGVLDSAELAKTFRGPNAKPAPEPKFDDQGNITPPPNPSAARFPDQVYLLALDKDGDGKVNWAEFDEYGEAYAAQFKNTQQLNQQALRAAYAQANRNLAVRRNQNYSRNRRPTNYRNVRTHRTGTVYNRPARRAQIQRNRPQPRYNFNQGQRRPVNYSPYAPKMYRPVKIHPNVRRVR